MTFTETKLDPNQEAVKIFRRKLQGPLILPNDPDYDQARTIWNRMIDRFPTFIVQCVSSDDVIAAVKFANEHKLEVAIKGGGHNVAGNAVCDGGLVIDLSRMKTISVDPEKRTAKVAAGVLLGELDKATQRHGLMVPAGIMSETGIAGLTLGGGLGWLSRKFGLTIDSLIAAQLVTANGKEITLSKNENQDLFWGIRGGGGNFGIVTSFTFQLHEVGPELYCGLIVYPFSEAKKVIKYHRTFVANVPDELSAWQVIRKAPALPFLPEEVHGQPIVLTAFCYAGKPQEGINIMASYNPSIKPLGTHLGLVPYTEWQQTIDPLQADGARNYWKSHNLDDLSDDCIDTILEYASKIPHPLTEIFVPHMQGVISRVAKDATAYGHRRAPFLLNIHGRWETPEEDEKNIKWVRDLFDATKPYSTGSVYVNFISEEGEERVKDAYLKKSWERLVALKTKYDPENFFSMNQNIKPIINTTA